MKSKDKEEIQGNIFFTNVSILCILGVLVYILLMLVGCGTTGKDIEGGITITNEGADSVVFVEMPITVTSTSRDLTQTPTYDGRFAASLPSGASTGTAIAEGSALLEGIKNIAREVVREEVVTAAPIVKDPDTTDDTPPPIVEDDPVIVEDPEEPAKFANKEEMAWYRGRTNGDRPTMYFAKNMSAYPDTFWLTFEGCAERLKVTNNGERWEESGYLAKKSDVSGRGMAVLAPASCNSEKAYIEW